MNTMTKRLAWKEAALLRPICISCLALLTLVLVAGFATINNTRDFTEFVGSLVMGISCVTALACGILMFVFERESGTDTFLECFPVDGKQVSKTKLIKTAQYFVLYMIGALLIGGAALALYDGGVPKLEGKNIPAAWLSMVVLIPVQCLLWAILCSLIFRSGLYATIASAVLVVVSVIGISVTSPGWSSSLTDRQDMIAIITAHVVVSIILSGAIWYLSPTWLRGRVRTTRTIKTTVGSKTALASKPVLKARCSHPYRSLVWQNLRYSWIPWLVAAVGLIATCSSMGSQISTELVRHHGDGFYHLSYLVQGLFIIAGAWIGMMMFSGDQTKSNFLFFQQQADFPRKIWFARLTIVLAFIPCVVIAAILASPGTPDWWSLQYNPTFHQEYLWVFQTPHVINSIVLFLTAAGLAQLATMVFRMGSGFVAFVATVVLSIFLFRWFLEVSMTSEGFLFLIPLMLSCFVATWWLAPRWISGRRRITGSVASLSVCAMVAVAIFGCWIWHRANEFSIPTRSLEWTAFATPNSHRLNMKKYPAALSLNTAFKNLQDFETDTDFPKGLTAEQLENYFTKNAATFDEISECLKDVDCGLFLNPVSKIERESQASRLNLALEAATRHHLESKDANRALDSLEDQLRAAWWVSADASLCENVLSRFWDWAALENVEEPLIREAIERIDQLEKAVFDYQSEILYRESVFQIEREVGQANEYREQHGAYSWELERSRRWSLTQMEVNPVWRELCLNAIGPDRRTFSYNPGIYDIDSPDLRTTHVNHALRTHHAPNLARLFNLFRYTKVRLALAGWKQKHETYPATLGELCDGDQRWLDEIPVSFFSGRQFAYSANGLDDRVFFAPETIPSHHPLSAFHWIYHSEFETKLPVANEWIEAEQPFLLPWSGVIGEKRPFVHVVEDDTFNVTQKKNHSEFAYWIPVGRAGGQVNIIKEPERFLLE